MHYFPDHELQTLSSRWVDDAILKNISNLMGLQLTPPDHSSRLTIIFATRDRPEAARRLVASIRRYFPDVAIIAGDQSDPAGAMRSFYSYNDVLYLNLDYDCSASEARAACASAARTEFLVLADDDFIFDADTDLSIPLLQLLADSSVGFVGGAIVDIHGNIDGHHEAVRQRAETYIFHDPDRGIYLTIPIDYLLPRSKVIGGRVFYECDATQYWGVMRKSLLEQVWWDPRFKAHGERENFFLDMKANSSYKVSFCPDLTCLRADIAAPRRDALRERQSEWALFGDKWKLRDHMEVGLGLRTYASYETPSWRETGAGETARTLPPSEDGYLRLWPNGQAFAVDVAAPPTSAEPVITPERLATIVRPGGKARKYDPAKETLAWKMARPLMKTELYIRRFVQGWKAA
jgi:hypothetical protein